MHIEPQSARFTIEDIPGGFKATVPARRNWIVLLFLTAWLVGWGFGEVHAIRELASPAQDSAQLFMWVWIAGWTIGGGLVVATILWQLAGKEVLSISPTLFEHRIEAFGIGRTRTYNTAEIKSLRVTEYLSNPFANQSAMMPPITGAGFGPIVFDYGARTFRMAPALEEAEAKLLVEKLSLYLPRSLQRGLLED